MSFSLGDAFRSVDAMYTAGDERVKRERENQRFDWEKQKAQSELSLLPDRTDAERTGYQLRTGQNKSNAQLLPQQTKNAESRLALDASNLDTEAAIQPTVAKTKELTAQAGLGDAQATVNNQPVKQEITNAQLTGQLLQARDDVTQLPAKLKQAHLQGTLSAQAQQDIIQGTLARLLGAQDKEGTLKFANDIAKDSDLMPNTNGKTFTDVVPVRGGPQGDGYNFVTSDGKQSFVPVASLAAARDRLKSGNYHFIERNDGSIFAGDKNTGKGGIVQQGDPAIMRGRNAQHTTADIQNVEWLLNNVPKYKGNAQAAWDAVHSSKEKTRTAFVMDFVAKNGMPGQDNTKLADDAGKIYDQLRTMQGASANAAASNPQATGTVDPRIKSLIGAE